MKKGGKREDRVIFILKNYSNLNFHFAFKYSFWELMVFEKVATSELTLEHTAAWPYPQQ